MPPQNSPSCALFHVEDDIEKEEEGADERDEMTEELTDDEALAPADDVRDDESEELVVLEDV